MSAVRGCQATRLVLVIGAIFHPTEAGAIPPVFPGSSWQTKTPAEVGLDAAELDSFKAAAGGGGPGVVIKDGYLVYSWGSQSSHGEWASSSKAVGSTLMFFAIEEGLLSSVDTPIANFGWALSGSDQGMTFRHLANMTSGYTLPEGPGAAWAYNDFGVKLYWLALLEDVYGVSATSASALASLVTDGSRLGPLQFQDGSLFMIKSGAPRVNMTPRDYARVGWFWVNRGNWNGQQLLPASYFDSFMTVDVSPETPRTSGNGTNDYLGIGTSGGPNDQTGLGPGRFGFMWWFNENQQTWPDAPADTFQANGHWNQEVMTMIPSLGIVAAWRGGNGGGSESFSGPMNDSLKHLVDAVVSTDPNCGNGVCESGESCSSCAADCGACGPVCGDGTCEGDESCTNCTSDCGACPPVCEDGLCEDGEDCGTCESDCGACPAVCGDGTCEGSEDCGTCASDCGACPIACGNDICEAAEDCSECIDDCGLCPAECGNGSCESGEDCLTCGDDCGDCPVECGNGECDASEACDSCPSDCGACPVFCGDGTCQASENCTSCSSDCGMCPPACGDDLCDAGEDCAGCPADCGACAPVCSDQSCNGTEDCMSCPTDCGACPDCLDDCNEGPGEGESESESEGEVEGNDEEGTASAGVTGGAGSNGSEESGSSQATTITGGCGCSIAEPPVGLPVTWLLLLALCVSYRRMFFGRERP